MGKGTTIEWASHTFNPWRGCVKVSEGCKNCYAETQSKRNPGVLGEWGEGSKRIIASEAYWKKPLKWNSEAEQRGVVENVFCASLADVFEDREDLVKPRERLFSIISMTPNLNWLLLTKRPENIEAIIKEMEDSSNPYVRTMARLWFDKKRPIPPKNVWLGVSVENQEAADKRVGILLGTPAHIRFISAEPLLGYIDLGKFLHLAPCPQHPDNRDTWSSMACDYLCLQTRMRLGRINWVIAGGESGKNARPMSPGWVRSLRDQCQSARVAFFFKQWGRWGISGRDTFPKARPESVGKLERWLTVSSTNKKEVGKHSYSYAIDDTHCEMLKELGKKNTGRSLDGIIHSDMPSAE